MVEYNLFKNGEMFFFFFCMKGKKKLIECIWAKIYILVYGLIYN